MAHEPKRRHSKARKNTRRASIKLEGIGLINCANCGKATPPHIVCKECGFYGKKQINGTQKVTITKA